jgi:acetyl-CoA carboxylase carboxyltransferase component
VSNWAREFWSWELQQRDDTLHILFKAWRRCVEQMIKDSAPYPAAGMHYIHDVIDPKDTRHYIIRTLQICQERRTGGVSQHRLANWHTKF